MRRVEFGRASGLRWRQSLQRAPVSSIWVSARFFAVMLVVLHGVAAVGFLPSDGTARGQCCRRGAFRTTGALEIDVMKPLRDGVALAALLASAVAVGAELPVPSKQYPTIQSAVDAASNGDSILIAPGSYVESINTKGKSVRIEPSGLVGSVSISSAVGSRALSIDSGEGLGTVIRGIRFTGSASAGTSGGGIRVLGSSPTIMDCVFDDIRLLADGVPFSAAMFVSGGSCQILDCEFRNCGTVGFSGSALVVGGANANVVVQRCVFEGNGPGAQGADLISYGDASAANRIDLDACSFEGVSGAGFGARIYNYGQGAGGCSITLRDCAFSSIVQVAESLVHGWDNLRFEAVRFHGCEGAQALVTHHRGVAVFDGCEFSRNLVGDTLVRFPGVQGGTGTIRNSVFCENNPTAPAFGAFLADGGGNTVPAVCTTPCPADLVNDAVVNAADMAIVLNFWGTDGSQFPGVDIDGDGIVGGADLAAVLNAWGPCPQ